jgi:hypothetical protein
MKESVCERGKDIRYPKADLQLFVKHLIRITFH